MALTKTNWTSELVSQIQDDAKEMGVDEAVRKHTGLNYTSTYYKALADLRKTKIKKKKISAPQKAFVDLPTPNAPQSGMVVVCDVSQIQSVWSALCK